ncbi:MAG: discoidin domain-containing protein [Phycisphaerae bacterium]|nr:discoidin domain-containing protein [Phycisphaerae bacterium]
MRHRSMFLLAASSIAAATMAYAAPVPVGSGAFRKQIEADWLSQVKHRLEPRHAKVTPETDAAGGCDGIKSGKWGFHTGLERTPWWQVDLGQTRSIDRVVVWNRCDGGSAPRNGRIMVLLSKDAKAWEKVYTHDGTTFLGAPDKKPLVVAISGRSARFVRLQLPSVAYLHLDEVEVFGTADKESNLAMNRPACQSSISQWSSDNRPTKPVDWAQCVARVLDEARRLTGQLGEAGADVRAESERIEQLGRRISEMPAEKLAKEHYLESRWVLRRLTLANPLLDFDALLVTKRVPGSFNHMSDQYYGWWSRPGGGIYILRGFKTDSPTIECITDSFEHPGSFLRPMLSYDGRKVLFAWCRHYPKLAAEKDKLNKANVPEDAFYHVFEMNVDGTGVRRLTRGKYDDFDARYLPDGRIVFLSTRRGQFMQAGHETACMTLARPDLPDIYVRCGGGPERPVAVYTLHTMNADGGDLCAISPFEMFEWTPTVADDGTILYSRWDYVDRWNMPFMSLWAINPDGTNSRIVYGNYTHAPHCTFEPRSIPNSHKIVFTGSGHHAQTMGSLVLFDPTIATEGELPITRLTPEVSFPEIEGWSSAYFANPWPLSERFHLVAWGPEAKIAQWQALRVPNAMGVYFFDAEGEMELLHRDPDFCSMYPIPLRARTRPPVIASHIGPGNGSEGRFLLVDVYQGLKKTRRGDVKSLRIVAVPGKTHPTMNYPSIGITHDDPGKCVLGTVPVEADGSAYFRVPSGVIVFFQALDERGMAVQSMRSATHVQPGQTLSCVGCHEPRSQTPPQRLPMAATREPSKITVGPDGSWPLRFDRLVQPVLDRRCVVCHDPRSSNEHAARFDLTAAKAYPSLFTYGKPSLREHVQARYRQGYSTEGGCAAATSPLLAKLTGPKAHQGVRLDTGDVERLVTWMDTYAQWLGSFSSEQEQQLKDLRRQHAELLIERASAQTAMRNVEAR